MIMLHKITINEACAFVKYIIIGCLIKYIQMLILLLYITINYKSHVAESESQELSEYDPVVVFSIDFDTVLVVEGFRTAFFNIFQVINTVGCYVCVVIGEEDVLIVSDVHLAFLIPYNLKVIYHIKGLNLNILRYIPFNYLFVLKFRLIDSYSNCVTIIAS